MWQAQANFTKIVWHYYKYHNIYYIKYEYAQGTWNTTNVY